ncbi:hypothetical protein BLTE_27550 [Blastochloris tepida]|uniref:Uncharacterized protein n=1 Tax=Blastochloris tepida TaxID=2233851 RepID=A0A348G3D7_9HYPH|nr:hypothetical protein BLTE_27550 [Blastochloris tepida]
MAREVLPAIRGTGGYMLAGEDEKGKDMIPTPGGPQKTSAAFS